MNGPILAGEGVELTSWGGEAYVSGSLRYSPPRNDNLLVVILYRNL